MKLKGFKIEKNADHINVELNFVSDDDESPDVSLSREVARDLIQTIAFATDLSVIIE